MKTKHTLCAVLGCLALLATALPAQVPNLLNYQGGVAVGGVKFVGPGEFKFLLVTTDSFVQAPANSANCEARFVKRLFVADNSALANGLGGPNPTLTTQALATRTAEKIYTRYFGGRSWVDRESPVSSIDPSVTRALVECGHGGR